MRHAATARRCRGRARQVARSVREPAVACPAGTGADAAARNRRCTACITLARHLAVATVDRGGVRRQRGPKENRAGIYAHPVAHDQCRCRFPAARGELNSEIRGRAQTVTWSTCCRLCSARLHSLVAGAARVDPGAAQVSKTSKRKFMERRGGLETRFTDLQAHVPWRGSPQGSAAACPGDCGPVRP